MRTDTSVTRPIVYTLTANCRDCYRCIRICPVKAIRVQDAQAYVDDTRCIQCGTCVRECPQHAKTIRSDTEQVRDMLTAGLQVAVSVAPSFATLFSGWRSTRLPSVLRQLGFSYVAETAEGAEVVAGETVKRIADDPEHVGCIGSACPAVVHYVEKYRPELVDQLLPVVSPMVAHARMLKNRLGHDWKVVFIGPCAAKKQEAARPEYADAVDAVLTFAELDQWIREENIDLATCPESDFECPDPLRAHTRLADARTFALAGGMLKSAAMRNDGVQLDVLHTSGAEGVMALLDIEPDKWSYRLVEPLFCMEGCINGPGLEPHKNLFERKNDLIRYTRDKAQRFSGLPETVMNAEPVEEPIPSSELEARFDNEASIRLPAVDESLIQAVFERTGKASESLQLNCGACGYKTCRDNAIAVTLDMAEPEMCIPYMRRLAEQRTDRIMETSPNGIVILDQQMRILSINPAFEEMFLCGSAIIGRQISYLTEATGYEQLASGRTDRFESILNHYGKRLHQILYTLPDAGQYVGIYMNLLDTPLQTQQYDLVRRETVRQAHDLLEHQIRMSQEMAGMLGRSTAKGEEIVRKLMDLYDDGEEVTGT